MDVFRLTKLWIIFPFVRISSFPCKCLFYCRSSNLRVRTGFLMSGGSLETVCTENPLWIETSEVFDFSTQVVAGVGIKEQRSTSYSCLSCSFWSQWKVNRLWTAVHFAAGLKSSCQRKVKRGRILLLGTSSPLFVTS